MSSKLMNITFKSADGTLIYNLGCNAPGNIPVTSPTVWYDSGDKSLNQTGCNFLSPGSAPSALSFNNQQALAYSLGELGYTPRVPFVISPSSLGVKLYLNGKNSVDGVAQPYIVCENTAYGNPIINYYRADNTQVGGLYQAYIGTAGANSLAWYSGQLYDDGTFIGCCGPIRPRSTMGGPSRKYYEWYCSDVYKTPIQLIRTVVVEDLAEYLPIQPEGAVATEGVGDFDATSDPVDFPGLPGVSVLDTGLLKMYQMGTSQLRDLANYLWSGLFDLDTFKKLFSDPMEAILNLSIMPINEGASTGTAIRIGNITTTVTGQAVSNQYKIIDFGTINMNEFWASYADYSPYTRLSIFLPYVGVQAMSIDDVMNGSIQLKAYVDLLTGSVQYILKSNQTNRAGHGHNSVLYTWGGNCQYQIPLTASNMSQVISSITGTVSTIAGGVAATVATGGLTAPLAVGMAAGSISNAMSAKTHVQRGGGIGGSVGIFGVQTPYLILERPEQVYPENYEATKGAPTMQTKPLRYYSGYVRVEAVNLSIEGANEAELRDIEAKLKGGVIV